MFNKIGFVFLATALLSGCQSISDEELELLNTRADKTEQENSQLKTAQKSLIEAVQLLNKQLEEEVSNNQIAIEQNLTTGGIKVTLQQAILFSSNAYEIDQAGAADILRKVSNSIDKNTTKLHIIGHTDNLPVTKKWRNKFSDNWDLSSRRAGEVARFFIWGTDYPKENITVIGRADVEPIASNRTAEGRAKNRRIELLIEKQ